MKTSPPVAEARRRWPDLIGWVGVDVIVFGGWVTGHLTAWLLVAAVAVTIVAWLAQRRTVKV
ncbi:MAG TPA: hypothetical protein VFY71_17015 [Planctomycetota bacterium]|nr:hypothetical protein [Planctomycetota bacterium]